jgi:hypothetical protein
VVQRKQTILAEQTTTEGKTMAYKVAKGNAPATGIQKSVPPDAVSAPRSGGGQGYGANGPVGNSPSVAPGKSVISLLGANLKSSVDDDGVLDSVIKNGTARQDVNVTGQLRKIAAGNVPTAHGMRGPDNSARVPGKIGATNAAPARKV